MNKLDKIKLVKTQLAIEWKCDSTMFSEDNNVFIESNHCFFKMITFGKKLAGEHVRYLHLNNINTINKPHNYEYKLFDKDNIKDSYVNKAFENALNYERDVIALGAYMGTELVALAGADDYMGNLWQIGIDTLPGHRNNGLASYLVNTLAYEIESRGMLPYYTTWSPNIASTTVALNTGFLPIWVEYFSENI